MHILFRVATTAILTSGGLIQASAQMQTPVQLPSALVERSPRDTSLPTIFIVGDSTADFHADATHEGAAAVQGWGMFLQGFFDPAKVNVVNAARGGRSSRTFMTEGFWAKVLEQMKPHDVVLIQLGQNDVFPINDATRARGTIPGIGEDQQTIQNGVTHQTEVVHTYGWYLRQYVQQTKAKGATPVLMSLTPRNVWSGGHVEVGVGEYRRWIRSVALEESNTDFVDISAIVAREYEKLGQQKVAGLYHDREPVHMTTPGAYLAAELTVAGLKSLLDAPVSRYLSRLGEMVVPAEERAFGWPRDAEISTLWILGDSTVRNGDGTGVGGMWGWGDEMAGEVDPTRMQVANVAVSGRSSRTYYMFDWPYVREHVKRGDVVLMQFGHNDLGDPADPTRSRASLPGVGDAAKMIVNPITGSEERVHTYGWYLEKLIAEVRAAGATPMICSPVPRNVWTAGKVRREPPVDWSEQVAERQGVAFLDLNKRLGEMYEQLGRQRTTALFADGNTHTTLEGAKFIAHALVTEARRYGSSTLAGNLSTETSPSADH